MLTHRHAEFQVSLVDAAKRTQEVSQRLPQAFNRGDVDFTNAVVVIVAHPLFFAVTDRRPDRRVTKIARRFFASRVFFNATGFSLLDDGKHRTGMTEMKGR